MPSKRFIEQVRLSVNADQAGGFLDRVSVCDLSFGKPRLALLSGFPGCLLSDRPLDGSQKERQRCFLLGRRSDVQGAALPELGRRTRVCSQK